MSHAETQGSVIISYGICSVNDPEQLGDPRRGKLLFKKYCKQCHIFEATGRGTINGPNLHGLLSSRSGDCTKKWGASGARLVSLDLVWTEAVLMEWLVGPKAAVGQYVAIGMLPKHRAWQHDKFGIS
eukprot:1285958-Amphidinium_carterae.1